MSSNAFFGKLYLLMQAHSACSQQMSFIFFSSMKQPIIHFEKGRLIFPSHSFKDPQMNYHPLSHNMMI